MRVDCILCGEICVDLAVHPVDRSRPLGDIHTQHVNPILTGTGGIVPNSGAAMSRLGLKTRAFCCTGNDWWGQLLRDNLAAEGIDTSLVMSCDDVQSSVTVVVGGDDGEHTFLYHAGASRKFVRSVIELRVDAYADSRYALFGYYALMPEVEDDLPDLFAQIRQTGCRVAMDAAGGGGSMSPLDRILPQVDIYVPSLTEGQSQTGCTDPKSMIEAYREHAPDALLGIKLGEQGALLSPGKGEWIEVAPITPPGPIVDTTGAGDCFYAGLIAGLARGLSLADSGRLAAAAGACSVTGVGAIAGLPDRSTILKLAGLGDVL